MMRLDIAGQYHRDAAALSSIRSPAVERVGRRQRHRLRRKPSVCVFACLVRTIPENS